MYKSQTVFILGAGASWHYGYPTGEKLVEEIKVCARRLAKECEKIYPFGGHLPIISWADASAGNQRSKYENLNRSFVMLADALDEANPVVIDYFLGQNPSLAEVGKFCITWVIKDCQHKTQSHRINPNRPTRSGEPDDWIRFIVERIVRDCSDAADLFKNEVHFITFNYDRSLESRLISGIAAREIIGLEAATKFVGERVIHVYGKIGGDIKAFPEAGRAASFFNSHDESEHRRLLEVIRRIEDVYQSSLGLLTISSPKKDLDDNLAEMINSVMNRAEGLFILGFGFDDNNCGVLNLNFKANSAKNGFRIRFTNKDDHDRISKQVGRVLAGGAENFVGRGGMVLSKFQGKSMVHFEKSIKSVYDALAYDFDDIE